MNGSVIPSHPMVLSTSMLLPVYLSFDLCGQKVHTLSLKLVRKYLFSFVEKTAQNLIFALFKILNATLPCFHPSCAALPSHLSRKKWLPWLTLWFVLVLLRSLTWLCSSASAWKIDLWLKVVENPAFIYPLMPLSQLTLISYTKVNLK